MTKISSTILFFLILTHPAYAYIDPGIGAAILQGFAFIATAVITGFVFMRKKFQDIFSKLFSKNKTKKK